MNARDSRGQAAVLTILFMTVLLGASAMALDVGSWFRAKRALQAQADSAALAGAQALPNSTSDAQSFAIQYASTNGGALNAGDVTFSGSTPSTPNDTISVQMKAPAPGFFSKLFGINSVTVAAHAAARTDLFNQAKFVAPIGVNLSHPMLSGSGCPCFDQQTTLTLDMVGPGGFKLLDIDGSQGGINPNTLGDWIMNGLDAWMPLGGYFSDAGSKFNNTGVRAALTARTDTTLLFPVYDSVVSQGSNLSYHVVGWVGFYLTGYDVSANNNTISGYFTGVVWTGIQGQTSSGNPTAANLGAYSVQLVN
ncbi:MAG TPA: TadE/TadG family type IV pilus assembly protein [Gaiellaceae bacterium]|jgi:hypothetical protein